MTELNGQSNVWIAVDWGTSNVRFWAISQEGQSAGKILHSASADSGAGTLQSGEFETCLLTHVKDWLNETGKTNVLICGMAGARTGWLEAPYADVTADIAEIASKAVHVPCDHPGLDVRILPGLSQQSPPDVIRGEETQLVGLLGSDPQYTGWVVMPGTHSKWIRIASGRLQSSATAMTGEMFALLRSQSILRHSLSEPDSDNAAAPLLGEAFDNAVKLAWETPASVLPGIFQLRASDILGVSKSASDRAARLSGLLIGWELSSILAKSDNEAGGNMPQEIVIVGSPSLGAAYERALSIVGIGARQMDGEHLVLEGLKAAQAALAKL